MALFNVLVNGESVSLSSNSREFFNTGEGRIRVFNTGTTTLINAELEITVPDGLTISGNNPTQGTFLGTTWTIGTINPGSPANDEYLDLTFTIDDESEAPWTITYVLTHDDAPDDITGDNTGSRHIEGISCDAFSACICSSKSSRIRHVDDDYDVLSGDGTILVNAGGEEDITIVLPEASTFYTVVDEESGCGIQLTIKVVDNTESETTNDVIIEAQIGEKIVNDTDLAGAIQTLTITELGASVTIQSDGLNWYVI